MKSKDEREGGKLVERRGRKRERQSWGVADTSNL